MNKLLTLFVAMALASTVSLTAFASGNEGVSISAETSQTTKHLKKTKKRAHKKHKKVLPTSNPCNPCGG